MNTARTSAMKRLVLFTALSLSLAAPAKAHPNASDASALSLLPIAVSVAAPAVLVSGTAVLTVVAVQAASDGTVWMLERGSDGARFSITFSGAALAGVSVAAGTAVVVTAIATGWLLSTAGKVIAFIPNELGRALVYNERVSR